jgi:hypothetical protein
VGAVERHAKEVLDLLRRRPMLPPAREIGDAGHAREGDNAAVIGADAELALSLKRGACHGPVPGAEATATSRACEGDLSARALAITRDLPRVAGFSP